MSIPELHEIPQIAVEVLEHSHRAVRRLTRLPGKDDAFGLVRIKVAPEVVGIEKQEDAATGLVSNVVSNVLATKRFSGSTLSN